MTNLVTIPVESVSICLKSAVEKNDGNLQISFVTGLNSAKPPKNKYITENYLDAPKVSFKQINMITHKFNSAKALKHISPFT